jgi:uncharacterized membrane protein YdjX (TVP38/TMEM64 family)
LIPAILPPPAPFKIFVLLAGLAGISPAKFVTAILIGRGSATSSSVFLRSMRRTGAGTPTNTDSPWRSS